MKRGSSVNMTYKEHFEYALLNRLDLLELDLKGSSQYLFIIVFLVYKIQKIADGAFLRNQSECKNTN